MVFGCDSADSCSNTHRPPDWIVRTMMAESYDVSSESEGSDSPLTIFSSRENRAFTQLQIGKNSFREGGGDGFFKTQTPENPPATWGLMIMFLNRTSMISLSRARAAHRQEMRERLVAPTRSDIVSDWARIRLGRDETDAVMEVLRKYHTDYPSWFEIDVLPLTYRAHYESMCGHGVSPADEPNRTAYAHAYATLFDAYTAGESPAPRIPYMRNGQPVVPRTRKRHDDSLFLAHASAIALSKEPRCDIDGWRAIRWGNEIDGARLPILKILVAERDIIRDILAEMNYRPQDIWHVRVYERIEYHHGACPQFQNLVYEFVCNVTKMIASRITATVAAYLRARYFSIDLAAEPSVRWWVLNISSTHPDDRPVPRVLDVEDIHNPVSMEDAGLPPTPRAGVARCASEMIALQSDVSEVASEPAIEVPTKRARRTTNAMRLCA